MDTLRNDDEREINHHGKSVQVNAENNVDQFEGTTIKVNKTLKII